MWMWNIWLQQTNLKALFFAVESTLDSHHHHEIVLEPRAKPHLTAALHQLLPMFPVVPGNWLAGFHWQWHLTFTVIEICGQLNLSIAVKSQMQLPHDQEIYSKLWTVYTRSKEQYWGTHKDLLPFLLVKYLKERWRSEVYLAFLLVATFNRN